jgi:predicted nucleic acid-binding protein
LRTTIRIDDALYRRVKSRAAQTGRTVSQVIGDAVRASLRPRSRHASELPPPDAFLAALAIEYGAISVTADRTFGRFSGLRWQHPLDG